MSTQEPVVPPVAPITQDPAAVAHIRKRVKAGAAADVVVQELIQRGILPAQAEEMVSRVKSEHAASMRRAAIVKVIVGAAVTVISASVTVSSYQRVVTSGGTYYVCWGAILLGLALTVTGILQMITGRERRV
jgi:predicted phage tail protein